jgi:hypothetical protein
MSNKNGDGGQAFPRPGVKDGYGKVIGDVRGMTLRDWFAGQEQIGEDTVTPELGAALMGESVPTGGISVLARAKWWAEAEARYKYMRADAMLEARK